MSLTIVITTYNRKLVLRRLLASLEGQSDPDFEVVVAIDGSTDGTQAMLQSLETPFSLRWVNTHCRGYGLAVARNLGILAATTELVAIIDDDCFPVADFVAAHKRSALHRTITGGPRTPASVEDTTQAMKMRELARLPRSEPISFERLQREWPRAVATECNICLYKQDFVELGLFSERLKIYGFIGQEFLARARHYGFEYQFNPDAEIIHDRQRVGDNDLSKWRRRSQIILARAINPSLMNATEYRAQVDWARRSASAYPSRCAPPGLPKTLWLAFPYRFIRNRAGDLKRRIRTIRQFIQ